MSGRPIKRTLRESVQGEVGQGWRPEGGRSRAKFRGHATGWQSPGDQGKRVGNHASFVDGYCLLEGY